jgi:hypothetical protein
LRLLWVTIVVILTPSEQTGRTVVGNEHGRRVSGIDSHFIGIQRCVKSLTNKTTTDFLSTPHSAYTETPGTPFREFACLVQGTIALLDELGVSLDVVDGIETRNMPGKPPTIDGIHGPGNLFAHQAEHAQQCTRGTCLTDTVTARTARHLFADRRDELDGYLGCKRH